MWRLVGNNNNVDILKNGVKRIIQGGKNNATYIHPNGGFEIVRNGEVVVSKLK